MVAGANTMIWRLPEHYIFDDAKVAFGVKGKGPPLVLVHGTPWSSYNLRYLIDSFSGKFTVYYYDLLGYGQSDKPDRDISLGIQNILLDRLLDHWQLECPLILGHDFGGTTVLRTHLLNQRAFQKMVLIDPVALSPWGSSFFKHVGRYEMAFAGLPDYIHEAIVRAYVQTAATQELDGMVVDNIIAPWVDNDGKAAFYRQIAQADSRYTDEIQDLYAQMSLPVMILWGKEDSWIPVEKGRQLQKLISGSTFDEIDNAGHLVIEEEPAKIAEKVLTFFA